jgi:hypothetical protein
MQLETALRLPALAMQLSNVVKTFVLRATNVPKRTANTMAMASARTPHNANLPPASRGAWRGLPGCRPAS